MADTSLSVYPVRCHACGRVLGNKYETFRAARESGITALIRASAKTGVHDGIPMSWRQLRQRYEGPATRMAFARVGLRGNCEGCRSQLMTSLDKNDIMQGVGSVVHIMRNTQVVTEEADVEERKVVEIVLPKNVITRIGGRNMRSRRPLRVRSVARSESMFSKPLPEGKVEEEEGGDMDGDGDTLMV